MVERSSNARLRQTVAARAHYCCEYYKSQQRFSAGSFSAEHIIPRSKGGKSNALDLGFSCQGCNNNKYTSWLCVLRRNIIAEMMKNVCEVTTMPLSRKEEWVQIAELDEQDHIRFTAEFRDIMAELGWEAKAFVGHLLGLWYDPFEHMLDYTSGEAKFTADQPGQFDRNALDEPQEVVEYWAEIWSQHDNHHKLAHEAGTGLNLGIDWYRDILRAKLVSLSMPKRLLIAYRDECLRVIRQYEEEFDRKATD